MFRMAMMHTKHIWMKWEEFWNVLQVTGVDLRQVSAPVVPQQVYWAVQDGHDEHQTHLDEVGSVLGRTPGHCS
jgi:hypothetical protein